MLPTFPELLDRFICFDGAKVNLTFNLSDNPEKLNLMAKFDEFSLMLRAIRYENGRRNLIATELYRWIESLGAYNFSQANLPIILKTINSISKICDDILGHLPPLTSIDVNGVEKGNLH